MRTLSLIVLAFLAIATTVYAGSLPATNLGNAPWLPRMNNWLVQTSRSFQYTLNGGSTITMPSGSFISFGGTPKDYVANDVWTTTDMINWRLIGGTNSSNPTNGYTYHTGSSQCQDTTNDKLYVLGGETTNQPLNVGYVSTNGGATFSTISIPNNRSYTNCIVDSASNVYLLNGILEYYLSNVTNTTLRRPTNQVWISSNGGSDWRQLNNAAYTPRMASSVGIQRNAGPNDDTDIIYVVGGLSLNADGSEDGRCDVYVSTNHGTSFIRVSEGKFPQHEDTTLVVSREGMLVLVGGRNTAWNEGTALYGSMDGGKNWGSMTPAVSSYTGRIFPAATFDSAGYLYIIGGQYGDFRNDIFKSNISLEADLATTSKILELEYNVWYPSRSCLGYLACHAPLGTTFLGVGSFNGRFHHVALPTRKAMTFNVRDSTSSFPQKTFAAGSIIIGGGESQNKDNDVWISESGQNGTWYMIGGRATMNGTVINAQSPDSSFGYGIGVAVCNNFDGDVIAMVGGETNSVVSQNNYYSTNGGATFTKSTGAFTARSWGVCGIDSKNVMYLTGGVINYNYGTGDSRTLTNDIWQSADYGLTWVQIDKAAPYPTRGAPGFAVAYNQGANSDVDILYLVGGFSNDNSDHHADALNDVWVSVDSGTSWIRTTSAASWIKRADHGVAVSRAGVLIVSGGRTDGSDGSSWVFNDVWVSFDGGYYFYLIEESSWSPRRLFGSFVDLNGNLFTIGGEGGQGYTETFSRAVYKTTAVNFNNPKNVYDNLHAYDQALVTDFDPECSGYLVRQKQACPAYLDPVDTGLSAGAIAGIVIAVLVGVILICGWSFYSIRVHGELRIPCTEQSCNCCNNALKGDQLADDGFALHKGTGKLKNNLNGSLHHRLIDE